MNQLEKLILKLTCLIFFDLQIHFLKSRSWIFNHFWLFLEKNDKLLDSLYITERCEEY